MISGCHFLGLRSWTGNIWMRKYACMYVGYPLLLHSISRRLGTFPKLPLQPGNLLQALCGFDPRLDAFPLGDAQPDSVLLLPTIQRLADVECLWLDPHNLPLSNRSAVITSQYLSRKGWTNPSSQSRWLAHTPKQPTGGLPLDILHLPVIQEAHTGTAPDDPIPVILLARDRVVEEGEVC